MGFNPYFMGAYAAKLNHSRVAPESFVIDLRTYYSVHDRCRAITAAESWIEGYDSVKAPTNSVLDRAKSIITGQRQTTNGKPERSFSKIAQRWSLTTGKEITPQMVALMMVDLKMVRALEGVSTEGQDDHFVDMAGYAALASEL